MTEKPAERAKSPDVMTGAELAEYYYSHRDDLAGDEVPSRTPDRMSVMLSVRFSPDEASAVRAKAARAGMSLSAFHRQCVLTATNSNVVDLARIRADLEDVRTKTADALYALEDHRIEAALVLLSRDQSGFNPDRTP